MPHPAMSINMVIKINPIAADFWFFFIVNQSEVQINKKLVDFLTLYTTQKMLHLLVSRTLIPIFTA